MKKLAVSLFALCLLAVPAQSAIDRSLIPADAQWLVHVNVKAALGSKVFKALQQFEPDLDFENNPDFDEVRERLGIDPTKDIHAVTVYGLSHDKEAVVVMLHTSSVIDRALGNLSGLARRERIEVDGLELSRWSDPDSCGETVYSYVARHAGSDNRIVLVSPDANDLIAGIEAVRGERESLADSDNDLAADAQSGAIVHVSASSQVMKWADFEPASNIAKLVRSAVVEVGEKGSSIYANVRVDTSSSADATRVNQILQGAMALAGLASEMEPEMAAVMPLLQGLKFGADGSTLSIHFEQNIEDLLSLIHNGPGRSVERYKVEKKRESKPKRKGGSGSQWH
jgi:hypothetical protein